MHISQSPSAWQVLIEERDEAIQEISQQIGEVHEIFQVRAMPALGSSILRGRP